MADSSIYRVTLDIKADGSSAVRAVRQVADESQKSSDTVVEGNKKSKESFDEAGESASRFRGAIANLAGVIGLAGLGFGIKDIISAGQAWQLQQSRLQQSLRATGQYAQSTMDLLNKSAEHTATKGGFAAPEQIGALAQFVRLTGSATKAVKVNQAAMELARGSGLSYTQTQTMLGQALTGNVGRLQKYLGIIQPIKTAEFALTQAHGFNLVALTAQSKALGKLGPLWLKQQEILHNLTPAETQHAQLLDRQATALKVLGVIQDKYGGSTAAFSRTTAGAISNAKNAIDLAIEKLGAGALPIVAKIAGAIASFVTYLSDHKQILVTFGTILGGLGAAFAFTKFVEGFGALAEAVVTFSGAEDGATLATIAWGTAMRMTVIGIAITALYLLITHFRQVKAVALGVWHAITSGAAAAFRWLMGAVKSVASFIKAHWVLAAVIAGPFAPLVIIITHLKTVLGLAKQITSLPGKVAHGVGHFLGSLFHTGGLVRPVHMAYGGPLGGFGGGDSIPAMLEPGEYVLRKESVQNIGVQNLNSINAMGSGPIGAGGGSMPEYVAVAAPLRVQAGSRVMAETMLHFAAKKSALSGSYVSG